MDKYAANPSPLSLPPPSENLKAIDDIDEDYHIYNYFGDYGNDSSFSQDNAHDSLIVPHFDPYSPNPYSPTHTFPHPDPSFSFKYSNTDSQREEKADETGDLLLLRILTLRRRGDHIFKANFYMMILRLGDRLLQLHHR